MLKKKTLTVPTHLPLRDIILDPALQVRPVSDEVAEEYAEQVESLPPVIVWDVEGQYLLADGWHRRRAHEMAGRTDIRVQILKGTLEQAKLFVANCDARVGVRRNRVAKRAAVLLVLATGAGAEWSDRKIGSHCGVSHTFVGLVRARLAAGAAQEGDLTDGNVATENGNALAEAALDDGNVATVKAHDAGQSRGNGGNVATQSSTLRARRHAAEDTLADSGEEDDHDVGADTGAAAVDVEAGFFGTGVTLAHVVQQAESLLASCDDDEERRDVLGQLLDALSTMMAGLDGSDVDAYEEAEAEA